MWLVLRPEVRARQPLTLRPGTPERSVGWLDDSQLCSEPLLCGVVPKRKGKEVREGTLETGSKSWKGETPAVAPCGVCT